MFRADGFIKPLGYSGFLSAVWMLWRMNRNAKQTAVVMKAEIIVPLRWFK